MMVLGYAGSLMLIPRASWFCASSDDPPESLVCTWGRSMLVTAGVLKRLESIGEPETSLEKRTDRGDTSTLITKLDGRRGSRSKWLRPN